MSTATSTYGREVDRPASTRGLAFLKQGLPSGPAHREAETRGAIRPTSGIDAFVDAPSHRTSVAMDVGGAV